MRWLRRRKPSPQSKKGATSWAVLWKAVPFTRNAISRVLGSNESQCGGFQCDGHLYLWAVVQWLNEYRNVRPSFGKTVLWCGFEGHASQEGGRGDCAGLSGDGIWTMMMSTKPVRLQNVSSMSPDHEKAIPQVSRRRCTNSWWMCWSSGEPRVPEILSARGSEASRRVNHTTHRKVRGACRPVSLLDFFISFKLINCYGYGACKR